MGSRRGTSGSTAPGDPVKVAQYVRMSTDHQRYSTENQRDAIKKYADSHGMVIVRTYADEGKSGLSLEGRDGLKQLIGDVQSGRAGFQAIVVYDISRWGRFQDADESAYYEYLCRRSGIRVLYCAEPFQDDGSPMTVVMKSIKRVMAGEYSRELSNKVFAGQCRLIELGFRQGGCPGFGLRRMLLDQSRAPKGLLGAGEQKSLQTDRVVLVPGPEDEIAIVQRIYRDFVESGKAEQEIADSLNEAGLRTDHGRAWSRGTVHQVLTNEKYVGNNVYNRTSFKLKQRHVRNEPQMWIRRDGAFEAIVPPDLFARAQAIVAARSESLDDASMLDLLHKLYERSGVLSGLLIDEQESMPSSSTYRARFGGLVRAYSLIGFRPQRDYRYLEINRILRARLPEIVSDVLAGFTAAGGTAVRDPITDLLTINREFTLSVVIARCMQLASGTFRWRLRFDTSLAPDVTIAVRMAADQHHVFDYYVFPHIDLPLHPIRLAEENNETSLDAYRFDSLEALYALGERVPFAMAA